MKKLLVASLLVVSATSAFAETYDLQNRWGIGGGYGYTIPVLGNKFDDKADADQVWNAHVRYNMSAASAWQFQYSQMTFDKTTVNAKVYDATYIVRTRPVDRFTPIFGLGGGLADMSNTKESNATKFAIKALIGMEYMISRDLMASFKVDYQYINKMPWNHDKHQNFGELNALTPQIGLTLFFGHDKQKSDMKPKHQDAPVPVIMDADKDGVTDDKDKCPGTEAGRTVNAYGCVPEEKAHIEVEVLFDTGKATLKPSSHQAMEELAAFLKEHPETKAEIQGHTDNVGSDKMNKALSQKRAQSVRSYLVEKLDVPAGRLSAYGYGEEKPIADNSTADGREQNRRVMAEISQ